MVCLVEVLAVIGMTMRTAYSPSSQVRARSLAGERSLQTGEVQGSIAHHCSPGYGPRRKTLRDSNLNDRNNPLAQGTANKIFEAGQNGIRDQEHSKVSAQVRHRNLSEPKNQERFTF
jgi:hypothetical protein